MVEWRGRGMKGGREYVSCVVLVSDLSFLSRYSIAEMVVLREIT